MHDVEAAGLLGFVRLQMADQVPAERKVGGLVDLRKIYAELREKHKVNEKNTKGIEDHSNQVIEAGIEVIAAKLLKECAPSLGEGRMNEISIELKYSLKRVARRIDRGFNFEVRMSAPAEPEASEDGTASPESQIQQDLAKSYEIIKGASEELQFLKLEGDPILSLPEEKPAVPPANQT